MGSAHCGVFHFSASRVPEGERLEVLNEDVWRRFHQIDISHRDPAPLRSELTLLSLPALHLQSGEMSASQLRRSPAQTTAPEEHLILVCYPEGRAQVSGGGRELTIEPGEAVLSSSAEPTEFVTPASRYCCVGAPRAVLAPLLQRQDGPALRRIRKSPSLDMLLRYVDNLTREHDVPGSPELNQVVARHVHDLVALAIGAGSEAGHERLQHSLGAARLREARAYVARHLTDARLTVTAVAAHMGVTPRYVQRLFEREGTTFSRYVLVQRLQRTHRSLSHPGLRHMDITTVALDAGFGDLSYFNRCFRRVFGVTPSEVRHRALLQRDGGVMVDAPATLAQ
jgi:AraC-like DNA-binding protein